MKLNVNINTKPQTFKGYDAVPLKSLYMQNLSTKFSQDFFEELKKIGQKENFDVFVQDSEKIQDNLTNLKNDQIHERPWAQDNKILRKKDGKLYTILSKLFPKEHEDQVEQFANFTKSTLLKTDTLVEGGNAFIGKKDNGEDWILVGQDSIDETSINDFLVSNNAENVNFDRFNTFIDEEIIPQKQDGTGNLIHMNDWIMNKNFHDTNAINKISQDFGIKHSNIYTISQPDFHLDMFIRPIGYPYVLVNDNNLSINNLRDWSSPTLMLKQKSKEYEAARLENYATTNKIVSNLEKYGFKPIRIAGIYGHGEVNYMNAIVHKHEDGTLTYITNSAQCRRPEYAQLDKIFEYQLKSKVPNIKNVYFIKGNNENKIGNDMMYSLYHLNGGIHCYSQEEPDFDKI